MSCCYIVLSIIFVNIKIYQRNRERGRMKRNSFPEGPRRVGTSLTILFVIELFNPDAYLSLMPGCYASAVVTALLF